MTEKALRNLRDTPYIPICVEMHKSMWCDDFRNYSCYDLCGGGELYENPDILNCSDNIKERVRSGRYIIQPFHPLYFKQKGFGLNNYVYVGDDSNGRMMVMYECKKDTTATKTNFTGKRHTL